MVPPGKNVREGWGFGDQLIFLFWDRGEHPFAGEVEVCDIDQAVDGVPVEEVPVSKPVGDFFFLDLFLSWLSVFDLKASFDSLLGSGPVVFPEVALQDFDGAGVFFGLDPNYGVASADSEKDFFDGLGNVVGHFS